MKRIALLTGTLAIIGLGTAPASMAAQGQASAATTAVQHEQHHPQAAAPDLAAQEQQMMAMHQKMMAAMKTQDAELDGLVSKMEAAKGDARMSAVADLLKAVVRQRASMRDGMMHMQGAMMGHMMQHMMAGMTPDARAGAESCPMMKMMGTMGGRGSQ